MDLTLLGNRIRVARERKGITQEDLAEHVDISPSHISVIERGVKASRIDTLVRIANELDVSADYLLQDLVKRSRENQLLSSIMELPEADRNRLLDAANKPK